MVCHWSCALPSRSAIATRIHSIAVRLSGLTTAIHKRTHPIVLSYLGGDGRFIAFFTGSIQIEQRSGSPKVRRSHFSRRIFGLGRATEFNLITGNEDSNCNQSSDIRQLVRLNSLRSKSLSRGSAANGSSGKLQQLPSRPGEVAPRPYIVRRRASRPHHTAFQLSRPGGGRPVVPSQDSLEGGAGGQRCAASGPGSDALVRT